MNQSCLEWTRMLCCTRRGGHGDVVRFPQRTARPAYPHRPHLSRHRSRRRPLLGKIANRAVDLLPVTGRRRIDHRRRSGTKRFGSADKRRSTLRYVLRTRHNIAAFIAAENNLAPPPMIAEIQAAGGLAK